MRLSHYLQSLLFASFFVFLKVTSWVTYSSMPFEVTFKNAKKSLKNPFINEGDSSTIKGIETFQTCLDLPLKGVGLRHGDRSKIKVFK